MAIRHLTPHSTPSNPFLPLVYPTAATQQNRIQRSDMLIYNTLAIHFFLDKVDQKLDNCHKKVGWLQSPQEIGSGWYHKSDSQG